ncbi:RagB/SusD family nutrient uptake outer membrane protein [Mucilaginibacter sp. SMC90]|uniref:RagB/SusD family nutrient uptake outer membrane protein n=1 Tax=Mucilaginibacter sp. SMC90 TaxID=2929803 RepID=UPI001FB1C901|nr:RagB/SusD family nutrient uptake outer membrane protein [Mucilaginibacter sp. SMC90]UOE47450.1 RagB/SusD family nutrient uptake outer membrane protein [Mucilaginibacter sp. SMC90]
MKKKIIYILPLFAALYLSSCQKALDVSPKSEFSPGNVLTSEPGIRSLLYSSYANEQNQTNSRFWINDSEDCTDVGYNTDGAENAQLLQIINFNWTSNLTTFASDIWGPAYASIRDANGVIENIDNVSTADATKKLYKAEARVLRAQAYAFLYSYFGPVPLRTSTTQPGDLARASDQDIKTFIETEITQSLADLPDPGKEASFGRLNKGNANGILAKFYLNTKQWQKAADASQAIISFGYYALYPVYADMYRTENEQNKEMLLVLPCRNETNYSNWYQCGALPVGYKSSPQFPNYTYKSTMSIFATNYRLRTAFVSSYAAADKRLATICTSFINNSNVTVDLLPNDNARCFKYWDNSQVGNNGGADVPIIRYADILLTRAEALNELNGPTADAFALINQVRTRAGIPELSLTDAGTKDAFRDAILRERGWEFVGEGKRREDLIRQGKFLSLATARGISATNVTNVKLLFPIPQTEIDANKLCVQNPGY